jgi:hypothetical protein
MEENTNTKQHVSFDELINSIIQKAGYSPEQLGKPHESKLLWEEKRYGDENHPNGWGKERTFNKDKFLLTHTYEETHKAKSQTLQVRFLDRIIKLEERDHQTRMMYKEGNELYQEQPITDYSLEKVTQQICTLLSIK